MAASERLRIELNWPESARPQMMLGALAPDAHTEAPDYDRTSLHPEPGADVAAYVIGKITPEGALEQFAGQAFALSVVAHLVADEFTRPLPADMPWEADSAYRPVSEAAPVLDWPAMRRDLQRAAPLYGMAPLTAEQIVAKRRDALARSPLADAQSPLVAATEMARVLDAVVAETLRLVEDGPVASWRRGSSADVE